MRPYVPGKPIEEVQRELGLSKVVKLASNENPLGPSPKAVEAAKKAAENLHLYPDASGYELKQKLSQIHNIPINQIMLGNGSDELIHYLGNILLEPGTNMVVAKPTFVRYNAAAELADIELREVPLNSEFQHDLPAMAKACDQNTRLIYVANPHNPTGTVIDRESIDILLGQIPTTTLLVLDEAYYEFAEDLPDHPSGIDYVRDGKNVICLRTFSKTYGLAGIRIGYGFAPPEVIDAVERAREPFNTNSIAQAAAIAACDDKDHLSKTKAINNQGLERIKTAASEMGFKTIPSHANFICIDVKQPADPIFQKLLQKGVIIRSGTPLGLPNMIRVSIGTEAEVTEFIEAFQAVMQNKSTE